MGNRLTGIFCVLKGSLILIKAVAAIQMLAECKIKMHFLVLIDLISERNRKISLSLAQMPRKFICNWLESQHFHGIGKLFEIIILL